MTFGSDSKVQQVSGTAGWEDSYSISNNVITFDNNGTKSYGIVSQDCKIIYTFGTQSDSGVKTYHKK